MRDHTKLPSYREVQAKKAQERAIKEAYADRSKWRPTSAVRRADAPAPRIAADDGGWIEWKGGAQPLPADAFCEVEYGDGVRAGVPAGAVYWGRGGVISAHRVVRYRPTSKIPIKFSDGWVEWKGGPDSRCPVDATALVELRLKTGDQRRLYAPSIDWRARMIEAYRIVK